MLIKCKFVQRPKKVLFCKQLFLAKRAALWNFECANFTFNERVHKFEYEFHVRIKLVNCYGIRVTRSFVCDLFGCLSEKMLIHCPDGIRFQYETHHKTVLMLIKCFCYIFGGFMCKSTNQKWMALKIEFCFINICTQILIHNFVCNYCSFALDSEPY